MNNETLGDCFPMELTRIRELLEDYKSLGPVGAFGYTMIKDVYERALLAQANQDVIKMIQTYKEMQECQ